MQSLNVSQLAGSTAVPERKGAIFSWLSFLFFLPVPKKSNNGTVFNHVFQHRVSANSWAGKPQQSREHTGCHAWHFSCLQSLDQSGQSTIWKTGSKEILCVFTVFFKSPSIFCFWNKTLSAWIFNCLPAILDSSLCHINPSRRWLAEKIRTQYTVYIGTIPNL